MGAKIRGTVHKKKYAENRDLCRILKCFQLMHDFEALKMETKHQVFSIISLTLHFQHFWKESVKNSI